MRFFHKFQTMNYRFFGLINGIMFNITKKTKYTKTFFELNDKYSPLINSDVKVKTSPKFPNKIWQLWLQGEDKMPPIVQKCTNTIKDFHNDDVVMLTRETLEDYIKIPDYIIEKYKKGIIPHANFSDIIRLMLLAKYGGCWVDATVYLTGKIPEDILKADFFSYKSRFDIFLDKYLSIEQFKMISNNFNRTIAMESPYFFSAKPGSALINTLLNLLLNYWKRENSLVDYLMMDKFFVLSIIKNHNCRREYLNMPVYYLENTLLLQHVLLEKFDNGLFERIKSMTSVHKLTHKNLHRNHYKDSFLKYILSK